MFVLNYSAVACRYQCQALIKCDSLCSFYFVLSIVFIYLLILDFNCRLLFYLIVIRVMSSCKQFSSVGSLLQMANIKLTLTLCFVTL